MEVKKTSLEKVLDLIQRYEPQKVSFTVNSQRGYTVCTVRTSTGVARGVAICSVKDTFNEYIGKVKAAGRALKALAHQQTTEKVRRKLDSFPKSWSIRQALRIAKCPYSSKSEFSFVSEG